MTRGTKQLDDSQRQLAEATARVIAKAEKENLADPPEKLITRHALRFLARGYIELRDLLRDLHDRVDQTDPHDPIGIVLTECGLERRPRDWDDGPRLVPTPSPIESLSSKQLLQLYCCTMHEVEGFFVKHATFIVRHWDGMDGCWTNCTGAVAHDEALRTWAAKTEGGSKNIAYAEIDYYRIFPGGTHMLWDGSEGREMNR